jgi:predicted Zn-dependent peptidase
LIFVFPLFSQERFRKSPPYPEPLNELNLPRIESATLTNGLNVTVARRENLALISLQLVIFAGESTSPENLPGVATFTANMLSKGAINLSSSEIEEILESIGGNFSTSTFLDYSLFTFTFLEEYLDEALDVLGRMILRPTFLKREIDNEKRNLFYSLREKGKESEFVAKRQLFQILFQNHSYQNAIFTEEVLRNITQENIFAFYDEYYRPNNASIVLVGNLNLPTAFRKVSHYLNTWRRKELDPHSVPSPEPSNEEKICLVDLPQANDATIYLGNIIFPRNNLDYFPFTVLNQVLGGTTGSRLFMNLRESKGYAYFAFSKVELFKACGVFMVNARVRAEVTYFSVKECLKEMEGIKKKEVSSFEVEQAKSYLIGNFPFRIETFENSCYRISEAIVFQLPNDYWNNYYENIMLINAERVFQVAQKYPLLTPVVVIVGDKDKILEHIGDFEEVEIYNSKGELQYKITKGVEK